MGPPVAIREKTQRCDTNRAPVSQGRIMQIAAVRVNRPSHDFTSVNVPLEWPRAPDPNGNATALRSEGGDEHRRFRKERCGVQAHRPVA